MANTKITAANIDSTSTGFTLADLTVNGDINLGDNDKAIFGAGSDLQIYHDSTSGDSRIVEGGTGHLALWGNNIKLLNAAGTETMLDANPNAAVTLYYDNSAKLATTSTGIDVTGTVVADGLTVEPTTATGLTYAADGTNSFINFEANSVAASVQLYAGQSSGGYFSIGAKDSGGTLAERIRVTSTGVGIGVSSPTVALEVGDGTATANWLRLNGTTSDLYIGQNTGFSHFGQTNATKILSVSNHPMVYGTANAYPLIFGTNDTERMRIDSLGNVGIGTTPEVWSSGFKALQLSSSVLYNNNDNDTYLGANYFYDGTNKYINSSHATVYGQADGEHIWYTAPVGTAGNTVTFSERMRIDSSGNLLVGATSNTSRGGATAKALIKMGSGQEYFDIQASSTSGNSSIIFSDGSTGNYGIVGYRHATDHLEFYTASNEAMRIDSSGNVGIGHTDANVKLDVNGAIRTRNSSSAILYLSNLSTQYAIQNNGNNLTIGRDGTERMRIDSSGVVFIGKTVYNNDDIGVVLAKTNTSWFTGQSLTPLGVNRKGTDGNLIQFTNDQAGCGTISCSGTTTSYNTSSDYRLKENVVEMTNALDRVNQLQPKRFNFISDADTTYDGFLAHEVSDIVPEAIHGVKDEVDEEGNPVYQGIDQSKLVPLLTKAIQEQQTIIDDLKSRIEALEG